MPAKIAVTLPGPLFGKVPVTVVFVGEELLDEELPVELLDEGLPGLELEGD